MKMQNYLFPVMLLLLSACSEYEYSIPRQENLSERAKTIDDVNYIISDEMLEFETTNDFLQYVKFTEEMTIEEFLEFESSIGFKSLWTKQNEFYEKAATLTSEEEIMRYIEENSEHIVLTEDMELILKDEISYSRAHNAQRICKISNQFCAINEGFLYGSVDRKLLQENLSELNGLPISGVEVLSEPMNLHLVTDTHSCNSLLKSNSALATCPSGVNFESIDQHGNERIILEAFVNEIPVFIGGSPNVSITLKRQKRFFRIWWRRGDCDLSLAVRYPLTTGVVTFAANGTQTGKIEIDNDHTSAQMSFGGGLNLSDFSFAIGTADCGGGPSGNHRVGCGTMPSSGGGVITPPVISECFPKCPENFVCDNGICIGQ